MKINHFYNTCVFYLMIYRNRSNSKKSFLYYRVVEYESSYTPEEVTVGFRNVKETISLFKVL